MNENNVLLISLILIKRRQLQKERLRKRKHRTWIRKIFTERSLKGEYHQLIQELKINDHEFFYKQKNYSNLLLQ